MTATIYDPPEIIECFAFYDRPVLFTCRADDRLYLVVLVDDSSDTDTWLYAAVSDARYADIRVGNIDLYDAFTQAEAGVVLLKRVFANSAIPKIVAWNCQSLTDDMLPVRGVRLSNDDSRQL